MSVVVVVCVSVKSVLSQCTESILVTYRNVSGSASLLSGANFRTHSAENGNAGI